MLVISLILVVNADTGWMLDSMGEACRGSMGDGGRGLDLRMEATELRSNDGVC
jgi:hypothetical protein